MKKEVLSVLHECVVKVLNAAIKDPELIYQHKLNVDDFPVSFAKSIFESIEICNQNNNVSMESIKDYLSANGKTDSIEFLNTFPESSDCSIDYSVEVLKKYSKHIALTNKLNDIANKFQSIESPSEKEYKYILDELSDIESKILVNNDDMPTMSMKEWVEMHAAEFDERRNGKKWSFNDEILDSFIKTGPVPGEGGLICAATGMGKSAYCLHLLNRLIVAKTPVMLFTLEMGAVSTMDRLLSSRTQIPFSEMLEFKDYESWKSIKEAIDLEAEQLKKVGNRFAISENPNMSLHDLKQEIRKFQIQIGQTYCIVIIDLLTMIKDFSSVHNGLGLAQEIELAINKLNAMSKELGFHYIGVVQLNRTVESDKVIDLDDINKLRPTRSSIKNSGALLERARWCISLFRPKYYADTYLEKEDAEQLDDIVEIGLLKANNSQTGKKFMMFDGNTFSLTQVEYNSDEGEVDD